MNKKIFKNIFLSSIIIFICSLVVITGLLFHMLKEQTFRQLKAETEDAAELLEQDGESQIGDVIVGEHRVTLIQSDGTVLYDNRKDPSEMENHINREEVQEALSSGEGTSTRRSSTLGMDTVYYAIRLDDGNVLRISTARYSIGNLVSELAVPSIFIICGIVLLAYFISRRASRRIIEPINSIDLDNPKESRTYPELQPLLDKLDEQQESLQAQILSARQKQKEFSLLTENMSEGFVVIDRDTNILSYNQAALDILNPQSLPSGSVLRLNGTDQFSMVITGSLKGERTEQVLEHDDRKLRIIANPVFEDDRVIGSVVIIYDVTEYEKREAYRREFTANVSHELKTPLTSISGFAELMKDGSLPADVVRDFAETIYSEARRLIELVNDIIKISSFDDDSQMYEWEKIDLYEEAEYVVKKLKKHAKDHDVRLSLEGEHAVIPGVRQVIFEVIYNLCDNAIKYNRKNGKVDVSVKQDADTATLTVSDTGIGIPQKDLKRIFERFYRVDKSHSKSVGGTGLGLSIVKHAALLHDAKVNVQSRLGDRTVMTVVFKKNTAKKLAE